MTPEKYECLTPELEAILDERGGVRIRYTFIVEPPQKPMT
jgi:hypothetical protein